jgi:hypothetical protein
MRFCASQLSSLVIGTSQPSPYLELAITPGNDRVLLKSSVLQEAFSLPANKKRAWEQS